MLDFRLLSMLNAMPASAYITSKELAARDEISDKTARARMQILQDAVKGHGAVIVSKQRYGYKLVVTDQPQYDDWLRKQFSSLQSAIPNSSEERFQFLLASLVDAQDYCKIEDFADQLCVGTKTLSMELKRVEKVLENYDISIERKPHYGIRINGSEFFIRKCCMDNLLQAQRGELEDEKKKETMDKIGSVLLTFMQDYRMSFSEASFQRIVLYLYVAHQRSMRGRYARVEPELLEKNRESESFALSQEILERMCSTGIDIHSGEAEAFFIMVYLAGRKITSGKYTTSSNLVVSEEIYHIVETMMQTIGNTYGVDFSENLDVRMSLYNHTYPFHIRMTYGIPLVNPMLQEIRQKYPVAYAMAERAASAIKDMYAKPIPEDEIGYFAILLEMALEAGKDQIVKKNILLVCITGKASSQFLVFRFQNEFGMYIDKLQTCSIYEFDRQDLSDIDYIFTTVPISRCVSIPIYEISDFLESADILHVRSKLKKGDMRFLKDYYRKDLFVTGLTGKNREEVVSQMCRHIGAVFPVPEGFYESVLQRESMGSTDYGNFVAIPHPEEVLFDHNVVCVGILEKPIIWDHNPVQLVVLVSVCDSTSASTQKFYEMTSELISNPKKIAKAIEDKSYESFMKLFHD